MRGRFPQLTDRDDLWRLLVVITAAVYGTLQAGEAVIEKPKAEKNIKVTGQTPAQQVPDQPDPTAPTAAARLPPTARSSRRWATYGTPPARISAHFPVVSLSPVWRHLGSLLTVVLVRLLSLRIRGP
mgnify:CR=1 FL=1